MSTKENIFDCALSLFSERGFNGVSIRDIAKAVGINESSIYNHFSGKAAIIEEVCNRFADTLKSSRPTLHLVDEWSSALRPSEIFKRMVTLYGGHINKQVTQMAKTVFSEQFFSESAKRIFLEEFINKSCLYYTDVLTLLEKKGIIKAFNKSLVAGLFNNAQITLSIQYYHCATEEEHQRVAHMMMASIDYLIGPLETEGSL